MSVFHRADHGDRFWMWSGGVSFGLTFSIIWCFCASPCSFWKHTIWFWIGNRTDVAVVEQWTLPAFAEKVLPNRTSVWCESSPTDMKSYSPHVWLTTKPTHCASIAWIGFSSLGFFFPWLLLFTVFCTFLWARVLHWLTHIILCSQ